MLHIENDPATMDAGQLTLTVAPLLRRAANGDSTVLPEIRQLLQQPMLVELVGNLASRVEDSIITKLAGQDLAFSEALRAKVAMMRADLAGPNATAVERSLVERIVTCWLCMYEAEWHVANAYDTPLKVSEYWQRRIDSCNRRYLQAVKTLAVVRKLAVPVILAQINLQQR